MQGLARTQAGVRPVRAHTRSAPSSAVPAARTSLRRTAGTGAPLPLTVDEPVQNRARAGGTARVRRAGYGRPERLVQQAAGHARCALWPASGAAGRDPLTAVGRAAAARPAGGGDARSRRDHDGLRLGDAREPVAAGWWEHGGTSASAEPTVTGRSCSDPAKGQQPCRWRALERSGHQWTPPRRRNVCP